MAHLQLSKANLAKLRKQLTGYQRFLPSLDMKRQQLLIAVKNCESECQQLAAQLELNLHQIGEQLPMLANRRVQLDGLCVVERIETEEVNIVGVHLREIRHIEFRQADIAPLSKPHWVAPVQQRLRNSLEQRLRLQMREAQLDDLRDALVKVTQRVNLFDKVLIPDARDKIKRIQIHLDDRAREAVVTSKIAKSKRRGAVQ